MSDEKSPTSTVAPDKAPDKAPSKAPDKSPAAAKPTPKPLPPWNVVLLDDDDHTYDYVILMLGKVFGHSTERAYQMAKEVDKSGRVIVYTSHKEHAELKRDQVNAHGADPLLKRSNSSMKAFIEPAMD